MLAWDLSIQRWSVYPVGDLSEVPPSIPRTGIPAHVPGCIHTDLIRAALLLDPRLGMAELEQFWVGRMDWRYECDFQPDPGLFDRERIDLVCDGLDTVATLELNGQPVGTAANMFHAHRFDVRSALRVGKNTLAITFASPIRHIRAEEARLGVRPVNGDGDPFNFIRKAACNFGWDWGPKAPTCGIWKPVRLEAWSGVRIAGMRTWVRRESGDRWVLNVDAELKWAPGARDSIGRSVGVKLIDGAIVRAHATQSISIGQPRASLTIRTESPCTWWPHGSGRQSLYPLRVALCELVEGTGTEVHDSREVRVGFREVRLNTTPDERGSTFALEVNGTPIFCKGANWIPDGLFPTEMTPEKYRRRLQQAADANMNMLRVWGGGFYEDDAFYDLCDELGILVWQDFMFACAMYPEEPPYPALIEAEARHQIARLSSHPSVALWCGGNECVWAHESWGNAPGETPWKDRLAGKTWGHAYYFDLLPRLVRELDPARPYWPNSPWSGSGSVPPNNASRGDRHSWDVRGDGYRAITPRFCSEFGHQSPANCATLEASVGRDQLRLGSPALEHRQRATGGTARHVDEALSECFRPPRDFDEWHYLAQLMQARALQSGIEWMRVQGGRGGACAGALIWQLNDAWPGLSWSLIDADGREKPAWHTVRRAFAHLALAIVPVDGRPTLFAVNDGDLPCRIEAALARTDFEGVVHAHATFDVEVEPRAVRRVADIANSVGPPADPARELITASSDASPRATWFYRPDKELAYPAPSLSAHGLPGRSPGEFTLTIRAATLVRDIVLMADRASLAPVSLAQLPTLLPGESWDFTLRATGQAPPPPAEAFASPPILWCANWFGRDDHGDPVKRRR